MIILNYKLEFDNWMKLAGDPDLKEKMLRDNNLPQKTLEIKIEENFGRDLKFGTAGLRGVMDYGSNKINVHTVIKATEALAESVISHDGKDKGVVIAYDTRTNSKLFAETSAKTLAKKGIKVYLFNSIAPTPILSFAVRHFNAQAGIMITASHNPPEYNGYKVYWDKGSQITSEIAEEISENLSSQIIDFYQHDKILSENCSSYPDYITMIGEELEDLFVNKVFLMKENFTTENSNLSVVYSPLHGTGLDPMIKLMKKLNYNVNVVESQAFPDPNFSTLSSPNPEEVEAYSLAVSLASSLNSDVVITTDPDADRIGVMVLHHGKYELIDGNALGAIIADYVLKSLHKKNLLNENDAVLSTIATDKMIESIAESYGVSSIKVHVGFKNIYDKANLWDSTKEFNYILGYEESFGVGVGAELFRDKDAISAAMIITNLAAKLKEENKTLIDYYQELNERYGYFKNKMMSKVFEGPNGKEKMDNIMNKIRSNPIHSIGGKTITKKTDFLHDETPLPKENVLLLEYDEDWIMLRPSGTEPKLKIYLYSKNTDKSTAEKSLILLEEAVSKVI